MDEIENNYEEKRWIMNKKGIFKRKFKNMGWNLKKKKKNKATRQRPRQTRKCQMAETLTREAMYAICVHGRSDGPNCILRPRTTHIHFFKRDHTDEINYMNGPDSPTQSV